MLAMPKYYTYISTHIRFISIEELINSPISLHCISLEHQKAYFVEMPAGANPFDTRLFSTLFVSQREMATYLYIVPLNIFYQYVSSLEFCECKFVWLLHTARSGSTVWAQIFNELPNWNVVSENSFLLYSLLHENGADPIGKFIKSEKFEKIAVAGFMFNISRFPKTHRILIKGATFQDLSLLPIIQKHFDVKILFSYRNSLSTAESWTRSFRKYKWLCTEAGRKFANRSYINDHLSLFIYQSHTQPWLDSTLAERLECVVPRNQFEWYLIYWCSTVGAIRRAQEEGHDIRCIKYENFRADCEEEIRKVFSHLEIDISLVAAAVKSAEKDSHADAYFSRNCREKYANFVIPPDSVRKGNLILAAFGFPSFDSDFAIPQTF